MAIPTTASKIPSPLVTYILQGTNPNDQEETFDWQNQLGQNIGSKHIQLASTGSISAIGPAGTAVSGQSVLFPLAVGSKLLFRGLHWRINGIAEAGVYNDATVWTLTVRRWTLFPVAACPRHLLGRAAHTLPTRR